MLGSARRFDDPPSRRERANVRSGASESVRSPSAVVSTTTIARGVKRPLLTAGWIAAAIGIGGWFAFGHQGADGDRSLFLLPAAGFDWDSDVELSETTMSSDPDRLTIVARPTDDGYDEVVVVGLTPTAPLSRRTDDDVVTIDGRSLWRSGDVWVEEVAGGWLVYRTTADETSVRVVVEATTVSDGEAVVDESDFVEREIVTRIETSSWVGDEVAFSAYTSPLDDLMAGRDAPYTFQRVQTLPWASGPDDILLWGVTGSSLERTIVNGNPGYFVRDDGLSDSLPGQSLLWATDGGHLVRLTLATATDDELISYAESLRVVDRSTWSAESTRDDDS